jgi:hypothetical protein
MATEIINAPMMKKTASLAKLRATSVGPPIPKITWKTAIKRATVGRGTGSVMKKITAIQMIPKTRIPSKVRPAGGGRRAIRRPTESPKISQRSSRKNLNSHMS